MCNNPLYRVNVHLCGKGIPLSFVKRVRNGALILNYEDKEYMKEVFGYTDKVFIPIPCGSCAGCRMDYAKQWTSRLMLESSYYQAKCFLTLTYSEETVPWTEFVNPVTGEIIKSRHLVKRDLQLFMKRLRKVLDKKCIKVRYFACGEYGSKTYRPHFHMILLGYDFPDKQYFYSQKDGRKFYHRVPNGEDYFISKELSDIWGNGHCLISNVTTASCRYVTNYCMKKLKKPKTDKDRAELAKVLEDLDGSSRYITDKLRNIGAIQNEFATMSRRPGIGKRFFDEHADEIISNDTIPYPFSSKGLSRHLRVFDKWFQALVRPSMFIDGIAPTRFPARILETLERWKEIRKMKAQAREQMAKTSLTERERRRQAEERLQRIFARSRAKRDF